MKKILLVILILAAITLTSCNQQTTESYNNTIVTAHKKLFETNDVFFENFKKHLGKPESKKDLTQLITETKSKLIEDRKPVDELVPFKDHGLRRTILEMYESTEDAMNLYAVNVDLITGPDNFKAAKMVQKQYMKLMKLDTLIKDLQVQYAYYNKAQLR